jgi:hypothetical protein
MRTSAARRESLLAEFDRSGLSAAQFAGLAGIKYQTFAGWVQKRRRQTKVPAKAADSARWLEAVVEQAQLPAPASGAALVLQLPGGAQAEVTDLKQATLAAALVRALAQPC